jgi:UDP-glucuronate 4-epimerase
MNILITGAAGFIGSNLVDNLLFQGHRVIGTDNFDDFYHRDIKSNNLQDAIKNANFNLIECDIRNKDKIQELLIIENIELVIHLAAKAGVRPSILNPSEYLDVNLNGTLSILDAMKDAKVSKLIFASSSSVYGNDSNIPFSEDGVSANNPISPYAASKRAGELFCHTYHHLYNFDVTCLRFFTVYGKRQRPDLAIYKFCQLIINDKPIPFYGDGTTERDYTYIDDIILGINNSINHLNGFNIYNLGNSNTISLKKLVEILEDTLGKKAIIQRLPMQQGDVSRTFADISKAGKDINFNPVVSIENGLSKFVQWYLQHN